MIPFTDLPAPCQAGLQRFNFEGRPINLEPHCAILATLRTNVAGPPAATLPDNLAAQFRPLQKPIPDLKLLVQLLLRAQGLYTKMWAVRALVHLFWCMALTCLQAQLVCRSFQCRCDRSAGCCVQRPA